MKEVWKDIEGYEGCYQVSNYGNVKSLKRNSVLNDRLIKLQKRNTGYCYVSLWKNNEGKSYTVHRLVAKAFIPNPQNKPYVNHINHIKTDNKIDNLEWCTPRENFRDAIENGKTHITFTPVIKVCPISGNIINRYDTIMDAVLEDDSMNRGAISMCLSGKRKTYHGYIWVEQESDIPVALNKYKNRLHDSKPKPVTQIDPISNEVISKFESVTLAGESRAKFNMCHIISCCKGKRKTHGGYKWQYAND